MTSKRIGLGFPPTPLTGSSRFWPQIRDSCNNSTEHKYLTSFGLGCTFRMRYLASLLFRQLKVAPRRPPTIPIRMKKPKSTAVQRWHFLSDSEHYVQRRIKNALQYLLQFPTNTSVSTTGDFSSYDPRGTILLQVINLPQLNINCPSMK